MLPTQQQPPIQRPSGLHPSTTPRPQHVLEVASTPPMFGALYLFSDPDSTPLHTDRPTPHTLKQLRGMLRRARRRLEAHNAGLLTSPLLEYIGTSGEGHETAEQEQGEDYYRPLWSRLEEPPRQYFVAFASSEEMRLLEELEGVEAEVLARKVARQQEELAWLRGEAERGVDGDDEQVEEGDRVEEAEAGSLDIPDVMMKVVAEVLEDDEDGGKEQREATSSFFEPTATAIATANRSVLPSPGPDVFAAANRSQRSVVRLIRPPRLSLGGETPLSVEDSLAHEEHCVAGGQTAAESWGIHPPKEDIFSLIKESVEQGNQLGSYCLIDNATETAVYLHIDSTLATPYRTSYAKDPVASPAPADDADSHVSDHLNLDWAGHEDTDSQPAPDSYEPGLAPITQDTLSTDADPSQVCQHGTLEDENLAQRGLQQWNMAQIAFIHRRPLDLVPSMPLQHTEMEGPSASSHGTLTPVSEGLAQRGLQQAQAAQAAFELRRSLDPSLSMPLHQLTADDEALAQMGFQQWNGAQAAFPQSFCYDGPSASTHATLTPGSQELAQRGREQWWAAQTAHHCRVRAERYRLKGAMSASTGTSAVDVLANHMSG